MLTPLLATTAILALFTLGARAQEPEPGRDAAKTIEFDDADVRDAIRAVLEGRSIDVVVADHVRGKVSTSVDPSEPAAALAKIAAALGTGFAKDEYGVLCVGGAPAVAAAEERMPLPDLVGLEIRAAMKSICDRERVPVAIGPDIDGMVMTKPDVSDWHPDGTYRMGGIPPGEVELEATIDGKRYRRLEPVTVTPGVDTQLDLHFRHLVALIRLQRADGTPVGRRLARLDGEIVEVDATGWFTLDPLPALRVELEVFGAGVTRNELYGMHFDDARARTFALAAIEIDPTLARSEHTLTVPDGR